MEIIAILIDEIFMSEIKSDELNSLDLRSDIENNNIYSCTLKPQGYVGNRPSDFVGEEHEDDTWAIDCLTEDGQTVQSYLYTSKFEYEQDLELLAQFDPNKPYIYIYRKLHTRDSEREYYHKGVHRFKRGTTTEQIDEFLDEYVKDFWGGTGHKDKTSDPGYWFFGEIITSVYSWQYIDEDDYDVLNKFN